MKKNEILYLNLILFHVGIGFLILFFIPLFLYLLCFLAFWFFTINYAAMRTAAPAFVYSLSLLNIYFSDIPKKRVLDSL